MVANIISNYCSTRVLLYAKIQKGTKTEKTFCRIFIIAFCRIFIIGGILIWRGPSFLPPTPWLRL